MDLRGVATDDADVAEMKAMIRDGKVGYQPFVFRDDLEVGEGWAFATKTSDAWPPRKEVVHWPEHPSCLSALAVRPENLAAFRRANADLRAWYEDNVRSIAALVDGTAGHSFLELGCNTGYVLHRLSALGASRAIGVDAADFGDVFRWFNRVTHTSAEFIQAQWDSERHQIVNCDMPRVDVAISVSVTCHVADPLHMLAYLCHLARKAVFFMTPLSGKDDVSITFGHPPNHFGGPRRWPASFDSEVLPSARLIELGLQRCGFGEHRRLKANVFVAYRTGPGDSIYDADARLETVPRLVEEGYADHVNIINFGGRYFGLAQDEGPFSIEKFHDGGYRQCLVGDSIDDLKRKVDSAPIAGDRPGD